VHRKIKIKADSFIKIKFINIKKVHRQLWH